MNKTANHIQDIHTPRTIENYLNNRIPKISGQHCLVDKKTGQIMYKGESQRDCEQEMSNKVREHLNKGKMLSVFPLKYEFIQIVSSNPEPGCPVCGDPEGDHNDCPNGCIRHY